MVPRPSTTVHISIIHAFHIPVKYREPVWATLDPCSPNVPREGTPDAGLHPVSSTGSHNQRCGRQNGFLLFSSSTGSMHQCPSEPTQPLASSPRLTIHRKASVSSYIIRPGSERGCVHIFILVSGSASSVRRGAVAATNGQISGRLAYISHTNDLPWAHRSVGHIWIRIRVYLSCTKSREFVPISLSDLPHVRILCRVPARILVLVGIITVEPHNRESATN